MNVPSQPNFPFFNFTQPDVANPVFGPVLGFDDLATWFPYDFSLQSGSPAIDAGKTLTSATSSGTNSTSLNVADASFFFDGYGIAGEGDVIQIGSTAPVKITSVNYTTETITLESTRTWTNGDSVSLTFNGNAPDIGAFEFSGPSTPSADFDNDGDVDGADFLSWQRGFGIQAPNGTHAGGDADGDKNVDGADLLVWQGAFGTGGPMQFAEIAADDVESAGDYTSTVIVPTTRVGTENGVSTQVGANHVTMAGSFGFTSGGKNGTVTHTAGFGAGTPIEAGTYSLSLSVSEGNSIDRLPFSAFEAFLQSTSGTLLPSLNVVTPFTDPGTSRGLDVWQTPVVEFTVPAGHALIGQEFTWGFNWDRAAYTSAEGSGFYGGFDGVSVSFAPTEALASLALPAMESEAVILAADPEVAASEGPQLIEAVVIEAVASNWIAAAQVSRMANGVTQVRQLDDQLWEIAFVDDDTDVDTRVIDFGNVDGIFEKTLGASERRLPSRNMESSHASEYDFALAALLEEWE